MLKKKSQKKQREEEIEELIEEHREFLEAVGRL